LQISLRFCNTVLSVLITPLIFKGAVSVGIFFNPIFGKLQ
jgi:hypothetical protein